MEVDLFILFQHYFSSDSMLIKKKNLTVGNIAQKQKKNFTVN